MQIVSERLRIARDAKGWTQAQLAIAAGVSTGTIGNIESNARQSKGSLPQIAEALGINHKWLAYGTGEMLVDQATPYPEQPRQPVERVSEPIDLTNNPEYPSIRRVAIKAQAGVSGYAIEYMHDDGAPVVFRKDWYTMHNYQPEKMLAMRVGGESMVPSLYPSDLIIMNTAQTEPKDGIAFVVTYEGEAVVKRLIRDAGQWWLSSDNQDQRRYPRKVCNGDTQIIGEVVYRQTERI